MRSSIIVLFATIFSVLSSNAGDAVAKTYPPIIRSALAVAVDDSGNKYIGGSFADEVDINPAKGVSLLTARGGVNQYFIRFDANSNFKWAQQFGGTSEDRPDGNGSGELRMATANGVVYIVTSFSSTDATLGTGSSGAAAPQAFSRVASQGLADVAILALNADTGAPVTAFGGDGIVTFGGTGAESSRSIVVDGGTVYVAGLTNSSNAGIDGAGAIATSGGNDIFILALDAATGAPRPSFGAGGVRLFGTPTGTEQCGEIAVSGSLLYLAGTFSGTTGTPGAGGNDGFVAAFDSATGATFNGFSVDGIQSLGGSDSDGASGIATDHGIVYVSGSFRSTNFGIGGSGSVSSTGIFDAFVVALNGATGQPYATFGGDGVIVFGGNDGSETLDTLKISDNVLYASGYGSARFPELDNVSNDFDRKGFFNPYLLALNAFTGASLTSFGNGDGLIGLGGETFITPNASQPGTFNFARDSAVWAKKIVQVGTVGAKDVMIDGAGPFDGSKFGGYIIEADTVFDVIPPVVAAPNPTRSGMTVSLTASGPIALGSVTWDFGDGSPTQVGNPITHVYTSAADMVFFATASSTGGSFTVPVEIVTPNVPNIPNIGDGVSVMSPLDGLSISLDRSEGGVLEFVTDISTLRANEDVVTKVFLGSDVEIIPSRRAIFKARRTGIVVADSVAKNGDIQRGRVRKMAAVSAREVQSSNAPAVAPDTSIVISSLSGKFLFTSEKPDSVSFKGTVKVPAGLDFSAADTEIHIGIGNVVDRLTVTSKGKASGSDLKVVKKASVKFPKLKGTTVTAGGEIATVQVQFSLKNLDKQGFDTEGIVPALRSDEQGAKSVQRTIQIALVLGGVSYEAQAPVDFKLSKKLDSGQFKGRRAN